MDRPAPDDRGTWVVSPHLLVAQAVTAALASAGATVETHVWETLVEGARAAADPGTTRHVIAVFDERDGVEVVEEVARLVAAGDVRVVVVTSPTAAARWGGLVDDDAVDVVTSTASVGGLAVVLERFVAGDRLMDPDDRRALRAAWEQGLDRAVVVPRPRGAPEGADAARR